MEEAPQAAVAAGARLLRGTIVRIDGVREIVPSAHGEFEVVLDDGTTLTLSRRYRGRLLP